MGDPRELTADERAIIDKALFASTYVVEERFEMERTVQITPEMIATAWAAFKGDRQRMGPGPGFREAIEAVAPLILKQAAVRISEAVIELSDADKCDRPSMRGYNVGLEAAVGEIEDIILEMKAAE